MNGFAPNLSKKLRIFLKELPRHQRGFEGEEYPVHSSSLSRWRQRDQWYWNCAVRWKKSLELDIVVKIKKTTKTKTNNQKRKRKINTKDKLVIFRWNCEVAFAKVKQKHYTKKGKGGVARRTRNFLHTFIGEKGNSWTRLSANCDTNCFVHACSWGNGGSQRSAIQPSCL